MIFLAVWHKKFRHTRDASPACLRFFDSRVFTDLHTVSLTKFANKVRQKMLDKTVMRPPVHGMFRYQSFDETQKCSPFTFFCTLRQMFFNGKECYPFMRQKMFRTLKFSERLK